MAGEVEDDPCPRCGAPTRRLIDFQGDDAGRVCMSAECGWPTSGGPSLLAQRLLAGCLALLAVGLAVATVVVARLGIHTIATAGVGFAALYVTLAAFLVNTRRD